MGMEAIPDTPSVPSGIYGIMAADERQSDTDISGMALTTYLAHIDTAPLQRPGGVPTVALVVFNDTDRAVPPGRVRFSASFPTRAPKPVTVRDDRGSVVPSRIASQSLDPDALGLPPGRSLWSLTLEFALPDGLPARTARAFAASYEESPECAIDASLPLLPLPVHETDCHPGTLPTTFPLTP